MEIKEWLKDLVLKTLLFLFIIIGCLIQNKIEAKSEQLVYNKIKIEDIDQESLKEKQKEEEEIRKKVEEKIKKQEKIIKQQEENFMLCYNNPDCITGGEGSIIVKNNNGHKLSRAKYYKIEDLMEK